MREFITAAGGVFSIHEKAPNKSIQRMRASRLGHLQILRHWRLALTADARR
jgi:hypothetical protein